MSIVKKALEGYKDNLLGRLSMLKYNNIDYVKELQKLQSEYASYLTRELEVTTLIEEVDKELAKYE